ncbi:RNA polymerase sigma factor [Clostridium tarantellae]|uniref:Sigma-70 family RNA polymerase sigma factor n=1 Tax=Clostridium tarantellae TaxID=39493 RepID=A0A6I1MRV6_9CLOT|nr:sigma-70 family RNA polymerase sigma factor [Clostridium tarantellae]MPQ44932.1 sigma-70 family RNA polymerase sigma factor [Clostridium tarantellae]
MDKEDRLIRDIVKFNSKIAGNELVSIYYKEIYIYVYKQTSQKELAMDLTQDIFFSMIKSIDKFNKEKASFITWLYKIATNKIVDYYRSKNYKYNKFIEPMEENEDIPIQDDFVLTLEYKEDVEKIQNIVNKMSSDYQEIFRLKIFLDSTFLEISKILNISESTVKTKYYSMIKKIKKEFLKNNLKRRQIYG